MTMQFFTNRQVRSPTYVSAANLKDSRLFAELAAIYKNALNKGPFISVSSSSNSDKRPQIVETHLELPVRQPAYHHYYFFPLKTIENEINKNDEHHLMVSTVFFYFYLLTQQFFFCIIIIHIL